MVAVPRSAPHNVERVAVQLLGEVFGYAHADSDECKDRDGYVHQE